MKQTNFVYISFGLALFIKLLLALLPGFHIDTDAWFAWAIRLNELGFSNFYSDKVWTNYTPGYLYVLWMLAIIKGLLNLDSNSFYYYLKLPAIFAEIILGLLIYKWLLKDHFDKFSQNVFLLILFTPVFIFNSAIWGQVDGFLTLFIFLTIYYLEKKQLITSSIFLGLSFLIKPQTIAIAPIFLLFLLKNFSIKNLLKLSIPSTLIIIILSWPFFPTNPVFGPINLFSKMIADYPYNSLFAYNFWGAQGFWISDATMFSGITYKNWGIIFLGLYWLIIAAIYFRKNLTLYSLTALACLGFYFLPNHVHERYLYPAIPFLFLVAWEFKSRILLAFTILISLTHLANLYYVYIYYNELYLKLPHTLYYEPLYNLLDLHAKFFSFISSAIFVIISILVIKLNYVEDFKKS